MQARELRDPAELDGALQHDGFLLFKHSLICPVSERAYREYGAFLEAHPETATAWIDVIASRHLSQEVERRTGVRHESPQALWLSRGRALWHASHGTITTAALANALQPGGSGE